jgi:hypothetical protein
MNGHVDLLIVVVYSKKRVSKRGMSSIFLSDLCFF